MNFLNYIFGLIHYPCVGLTIIADDKYAYTNMTIKKYLFALILFFSASYIQYNVYLTWILKNSYQNETNSILNNCWIVKKFLYLYYITENFIYISLFIASHRTSAMASLAVWVFVNHTLSVLLNYQYYRGEHPSTRYTIVPFIL